VTSVKERRLKYGMVITFLEEPANSSTRKMEAEDTSEMLVPVYKLLRRLVPRISQY